MFHAANTESQTAPATAYAALVLLPVTMAVVVFLPRLLIRQLRT